jgi:hypothetical protein
MYLKQRQMSIRRLLKEEEISLAIMRLDLPIALGDPLHFESDTFFCHEAEYGWIAQGCKPENGPPYSGGTSTQRLRQTRCPSREHMGRFAPAAGEAAGWL